MSNVKRMIKKVLITTSIILTQQAAATVHGHETQAMAHSHSHEVIAPVHIHEHLTTDAYQQKMILYYVNAYRVKHHLPPLTMVNVISEEAAKHSRDMASHAMPFGHNEFNGRIKRLYKQINDCNGGAENVAYYRLDAKKLVEQWVASPGHRRNIEGGYNLTGIGIAHGKEGWAYYTQIFLRSDGRIMG